MVEDWESDWREEDFSWAGLKKRRLSQMANGANLQDYWRRGPGSGREHDRRSDQEIDRDLQTSGELVADGDGILWHLVHAPPDGTVPEKIADEGRFTTSALLKRRVDAAAVALCNPTIPPAQFQGVRTTSALAADGISFAAFNGAWADVAAGSSFKGARFAPWCTFEDARFADGCSFAEATFGDGCHFNKARFGAQTCFKGAVFGDRCRFDNATFGRDVSFAHSTFGKVAQFINARFGHRVDFSSVTFGGYAIFSDSTFENRASFAGAKFGPGLSFEYATFQEAIFSAAAFAKNASFAGAKFMGDLDFGADEAASCLADPATAGIADISFQGAVFGSDASFTNRTFRGAAVFDRTVWRGVPLFHGCTARPDISFSGATFPCLEREHWAYDRGTPDESLRRLTGYDNHSAFGAAKQMRVDRMVPPLDPRWLSAWRRRGRRWTPVQVQDTGHDSFEKLRFDEKSGLERRYADMERAFRTLKLMMENVRSKTEEARFFRLELVARRRRLDRRMVSRGEIFFSWLYWQFSDYGESLFRPVVGLGASILAFAATFLGISLATPVSGTLLQKVERSLTLSAGNVFQPFSTWSATNAGNGGALVDPLRPEEAFLSELLTHALWPTRLLSTAESVFAIAMIFLLLLALRRRFQIS